MAEPLRHRQTKEAATDMFYLKPPRHISTLPFASVCRTTATSGLLRLTDILRIGGHVSKVPTAVIFERPVIVPKRRSRHSSTAALIGFTNDGHAARSSAKPAAQSSKSSSSPRGTLVAARC